MEDFPLNFCGILKDFSLQQGFPLLSCCGCANTECFSFRKRGVYHKKPVSKSLDDLNKVNNVDKHKVLLVIHCRHVGRKPRGAFS